MDELIVYVSEKTYAYGAIRVENQNLLTTISELKKRLEKAEKGKSVNTKFDKTNGFQSLLCVTPLNKQAFKKKSDVPKTEETNVVSKPVTLQTSPTKQTRENQTTNVIRPGIYRVITTQESQTSKTKSALSSTKMNATSRVRRPMISKSKIDVESASKAKDKVVQIVLWVVDSGCSKHMTGDRSLLRNFIEKFMGTVRFGLGHTSRKRGQYLMDGELKVAFSSKTSLLYESGSFRIYNRRTKMIMETIHVNFDELTVMDSEHDCLEPELQRFNNHNSSAKPMHTPSKEDLDNLFSPMFKEYYEQKSSDTPIYSAAQPTQVHEDSTSTSSIIIDTHEAPPVVTTSDEQTSPISLTEADEFNQEDNVEFNGNAQFVPYNPPGREEIESSTTALVPSNV
ncbi:hypothetical protein Tco_0971701 [Tanacetum coccineum]